LIPGVEIAPFRDEGSAQRPPKFIEGCKKFSETMRNAPVLHMSKP